MPAKALAKIYLKSRMKRDYRGCWLWQGPKTPKGYGFLAHRDWKQNYSVHRFAMYLWRNFDLTSELNVCHTCDVRHCFNPRHLWLGTQSENIVDGFRKGRMDRGEHHKNAKLSEKNVIAILRALDRGVNQTKLAARYSVAGSVISRIKTGTRWNYTWKAYHAAK